MRRYTTSIICLFLTTCSSCAVPDMLFAALGRHYSGGGYTAADKKRDFDQRVQEFETYEAHSAKSSR